MRLVEADNSGKPEVECCNRGTTATVDVRTDGPDLSTSFKTTDSGLPSGSAKSGAVYRALTALSKRNPSAAPRFKPHYKAARPAALFETFGFLNAASSCSRLILPSPGQARWEHIILLDCYRMATRLPPICNLFCKCPTTASRGRDLSELRAGSIRHKFNTFCR